MPRQMVPLNLIEPPSDPINGIDDAHVDRLAAGYRSGDPIPDVTLFPIKGGRFETLHGQHRVKGRERAGFTDIPANILDKAPTPLEALTLRFRENAAQRGLSRMERAMGMFRARELGQSIKQIAVIFEVSEATASRELTGEEGLADSLRPLRASLSPLVKWSLARLPEEIQPEFFERHKGEKVAEFVELVNAKLAEIGQGTSKCRPLAGKTPNGIIYRLPLAEASKTLADLKRLVAGFQRVVDGRLAASDLNYFVRNGKST